MTSTRVGVCNNVISWLKNQCIRYHWLEHAWLDIAWWCRQMKTFSALLAFCAGNQPVPGEFPAQRPVTRTLMFSLICARINGWVNNREAGDLRCHHAHYDVPGMDYCALKLPLKKLKNFLILSHWGRVTHIWVSKLTTIDSDNDLSPGHYLNQCWNFVNPLGTNFSENLIEIYTFSSKKMAHFKMSSGKWRPFCLGLKPKFEFIAHDDVIKWEHFRRYWPFVRGIHRSSVNSRHKGQWREALMAPWQISAHLISRF